MTIQVGDLLEVEVGPVAHGGHFVARISTELDQRPRVIFVRHTLPGERVLVQVTEDSGSFLRGDAVEVREASPHRVEAPCPLARPDGCGGCDFQHVEPATQRDLKAAVVREQLQRLAGIERDVVVEEVPPFLRWRTRMQYVPVPGGRPGEKGLRKYRSHDVIPVEDCLIAAPDAREAGARGMVTERVHERSFEVDADGFWQVHPAAATTLVDTVLEMLEPQRGERVLDLYAGVGLFTRFLAEAVGSSGEVVAVESDRRATAHAAANLSEQGWAQVVYGRVDTVLTRSPNLVADLVVLDPPRAGAKRKVVDAVAALKPRAIAYVACDPAALARDLAYFAGQGYQFEDLRAFDLFPMTHHVECVALLTKSGSDLR